MKDDYSKMMLGLFWRKKKLGKTNYAHVFVYQSEAQTRRKKNSTKKLPLTFQEMWIQRYKAAIQRGL
ncbi:hypothetical protein GHT06_011893 [Daphnia sinensis]|uniref:Uncharacterized protein n=1 Tax=Daphnia sinensis TaxID=1820382 RepID=A0AAD5KUW2_9CRUS|nr:hypothetical protein GHT06_011893 [Daphnia sinensis]